MEDTSQRKRIRCIVVIGKSLAYSAITSPEPPNSARLQKDEWLGALAVFFWVFVTTFPVTLPFMFVDQLHRAMRLSNLIAVVMLFITGFVYGRCIRRSPWLFGLSMVGLGIVLVGLTIALGG